MARIFRSLKSINFRDKPLEADCQGLNLVVLLTNCMALEKHCHLENKNNKNN